MSILTFTMRWCWSWWWKIWTENETDLDVVDLHQLWIIKRVTETTTTCIHWLWRDRGLKFVQVDVEDVYCGLTGSSGILSVDLTSCLWSMGSCVRMVRGRVETISWGGGQHVFKECFGEEEYECDQSKPKTISVVIETP